jgi:hypothetical protein
MSFAWPHGRSDLRQLKSIALSRRVKAAALAVEPLADVAWSLRSVFSK